MDITGRKLFVKALQEEGVDTIFGYPGGTVTDLFDELYKQDSIDVVLPRHEQGLIHAAEGYAKSTGKVGVCLVTSGPGATNIITGLADAHYDSIPLVCFTGQVPLSLIGNDAFQEVDIVGMTRSVTKYGVIYGGVQKNVGPAGVVIVIIREDLITEDTLPGTPTMLKYKTHADADSLYNTPPCYGIYICGKVFKWLKKMGGLSVMKERNEEKAKILYDFLDQSKLFKGTVVPEDRSLMNVPFVTGDADLDAKFVKEATEAGFVNLKGHRTVGGMRASIYNAMPKEGVEKLVEFMKKFEEENA